jgi:hypothetical protein
LYLVVVLPAAFFAVRPAIENGLPAAWTTPPLIDRLLRPRALPGFCQSASWATAPTMLK